MKLVSYTNHSDLFYYRPRVYPWNTELTKGLESFCTGNIQGFSGHQGSILSDNLFADLFETDQEIRKNKIKEAYTHRKGVKDPEYFRKYLKPNWLESTCDMALRLQKLFGQGNFFIELQNELDTRDQMPCYIHPLIVECLRLVAKETGIMKMASSDPHYPTREDAVDQRVMVSIQLKETEESVQSKIDSTEDADLLLFFGSDSFYIHSFEEMQQKFTPEELDNTILVANAVEEYDITSKPLLPSFSVPNDFIHDKTLLVDNMSSDSDKYLLYLAIEGGKRIKPWERTGIPKQDYWNRLQRECSVLFKAKLSDYFLTIWDMCLAADNRPADHSFDWRKNHDIGGSIDPVPRGKGRGSAAGCLLSYLLTITGVDPLEYGLMFERFYNDGRNTATHVSLPDIDTDFSIMHREWVVDYLKWKYGKDNVGKIITFGSIKGKASIKDIMRVKNIPGGFDYANDIVKHIPDEATVADELQEMRDAGEKEYGLLQWTIDNVEDFSKLYDNQDLKPIVDQAIRIEGTIKSKGKHPAGIVIVPGSIEEHFPITLDSKGKEPLIGVDMHYCEMMGGIKLDVLGTAVLDKLQMGQDLVNGKIRTTKMD